MTADPMQRARELLAAEYEADDRIHTAASIERGDKDGDRDIHRALRAIQAALLTREEEVRGEERERAARIVENYQGASYRALDHIAAAIRADREG